MDISNLNKKIEDLWKKYLDNEDQIYAPRTKAAYEPEAEATSTVYEFTAGDAASAIR